MNLHVVYRATGRDNAKPRPQGFSKLRSLQSFLAAREACGAAGELVFLNAGALPVELLSAMRSAGEIVARPQLALHESYWAALELALARWDDGDLVYFAEDDYLYRREALHAIVAAARSLPEAGYLAPYATIGDRMPNGAELHPGLRRPAVTGERLAEVEGVAWHRATSHTSSFAVRIGVLSADLPLHRVAPRCGPAFDHALSLAYQGLAPYGPGELLGRAGATWSRRAKIVTWRALLSALAGLRRARPRLLVAPRPALATHMEVGLLALGTDWSAA